MNAVTGDDYFWTIVDEQRRDPRIFGTDYATLQSRDADTIRHLVLALKELHNAIGVRGGDD